jgi:hypothetical protein
MSKLRILRLFGNPLEFLPEIIPCTNLRHLSLANVRIEGDQALSTIKVDIEVWFYSSVFKLSRNYTASVKVVKFKFESW